MLEPDSIKSQILAAFADVEYPGDWCLCGSSDGEEPPLLAAEFRAKSDWRSLDPAFLDRAPDGYGSALSFFSDEAFRFYLPAYLIADIDGRLELQDPAAQLTRGLTDGGKAERVNPRRYGARTWFEESSQRFAVFNRAQSLAILNYLWLKGESDDSRREAIQQAIENYWLTRGGEAGA
jgi:hypothetical protein